MVNDAVNHAHSQGSKTENTKNICSLRETLQTLMTVFQELTVAHKCICEHAARCYADTGTKTRLNEESGH